MGILNLNFIATFLGSCNELSVLAEVYCISYVHFIILHSMFYSTCPYFHIAIHLKKKMKETLLLAVGTLSKRKYRLIVICVVYSAFTTTKECRPEKQVGKIVKGLGANSYASKLWRISSYQSNHILIQYISSHLIPF